MARTPKNNQLTNQLWQNYRRSRTTDDRNRLFEHYSHVLDNWTTSFEKKLTKNFRADYDDLRNAGAVAMLLAIERFDMTKGTTFEQYAYRPVRGGMMDYLRRWGRRGHKPLHFTSIDKRSDDGAGLYDMLPSKADTQSLARLELDLMIKRLPEKHQKVFRLKAQGLTHEAIAKELSYTPTWISKIFKEGLCVLQSLRRLRK